MNVIDKTPLLLMESRFLIFGRLTYEYEEYIRSRARDWWFQDGSGFREVKLRNLSRMPHGVTITHPPEDLFWNY
jgi:hypothetical protein